MEIRIGGELLDYFPQDISFQHTTENFGDSIGDQYSTDFELPRSERNNRILKAYGLLDGNNPFRHRIPCSVSVGLMGIDGYMQVKELKKHTITAAVFLNALFYDTIDRKVRDLVRIPTDIKEWDTIAPTSFVGGHGSGLQRAAFANGEGVGLNPSLQPWSLRLTEFLATLGSVTGINFNISPSQMYRVVASTPKVSPLNKYQAVYINNYTWSNPEDGMYISQHVCTDVSDPMQPVTQFKITRACDVKMTAYGMLALTLNGTLVWSQTNTSVTPSNPSTPFTVSLQAGDVLSFGTISSLYPECPVLIEYSNYAMDDEDTDDLIFGGLCPASDGSLVAVPRSGGGPNPTYLCDGNGGRVRLSWSYMDFWWCIGDMKVRELVAALAHLENSMVATSGMSIDLVAPKEKVVDGNITAIRPASEKFGQVTRKRWNSESDVEGISLRFVGDFLADEVTLFQSIFYGAKASASDFGMAVVPMSRNEESPITRYLLKNETVGAVMLVEMSYPDRFGTRYALSPLPDMGWMGLEDIADIIEVDFETLDDLGGVSIIHYEGRKYMIETTDTDADTGMTTATCILIS